MDKFIKRVASIPRNVFEIGLGLILSVVINFFFMNDVSFIVGVVIAAACFYVSGLIYDFIVGKPTQKS